VSLEVKWCCGLEKEKKRERNHHREARGGFGVDRGFLRERLKYHTEAFRFNM